ncbi:MAG: hypothetical protein ACLFUN_10275, partial [Desulfobacterales bacterium]
LCGTIRNGSDPARHCRKKIAGSGGIDSAAAIVYIIIKSAIISPQAGGGNNYGKELLLNSGHFA